MARAKIGNVFRGMGARALQGAGHARQPARHPDRRAARRRRRHRRLDVLRGVEEVLQGTEKFGTGHVEGIIEAGASSNSALAGAWIPRSCSAFRGLDHRDRDRRAVLKGSIPGRLIFMKHAPAIYAIFIVFILANLLMMPLGIAAHQGRRQLARAAPGADAGDPAVLRRRLVCHQQLHLARAADAGLRGDRVLDGREWLPGRAGDPRHGARRDAGGAFHPRDDPGDGELVAFVQRPIAAGLAAAVLVVLAWPVAAWLLRRKR